MNENKLKILIYSSLALSFILWLLIFVFFIEKFWLGLTLSTAILCFCALRIRGRFLYSNEISVNNILIGFVAVAVLYGIFWLGNWMMSGFLSVFDQSELWRSNLQQIYKNGGGYPKTLIALLLMFPIGFGEELFWRGAIQRYFASYFGGKKAFFLVLLIYTAIHICTLNPVLIAAAFTCGFFWGALYWRCKSIIPGLISHMLWDPLIFIYYPIF